MPQIFKALATITAWALFILAWITGVSAFIMGIINGSLYGDEEPSMALPAFFAIALADAFLAVVVMRLRQKME
jgi:hypothetical protein